MVIAERIYNDDENNYIEKYFGSSTRIFSLSSDINLIVAYSSYVLKYLFSSYFSVSVVLIVKTTSSI